MALPLDFFLDARRGSRFRLMFCISNAADVLNERFIIHAAFARLGIGGVCGRCTWQRERGRGRDPEAPPRAAEKLQRLCWRDELPSDGTQRSGRLRRA